MRMLAIILFIFLLPGCKKHKDCTQVVVTLTAPSCSHVGVIINDTKYPTDDLPAQYAEEGRIICIDYTFYEDMRLCVCCGGTRVHVVAVR